jgi:hypothetical protein
VVALCVVVEDAPHWPHLCRAVRLFITDFIIVFNGVFVGILSLTSSKYSCRRFLLYVVTRTSLEIVVSFIFREIDNQIFSPREIQVLHNLVLW